MMTTSLQQQQQRQQQQQQQGRVFPPTSTTSSTTTTPTLVDVISVPKNVLLWDTYKKWVIKYKYQLEVVDDIISRILFWIPHYDTDHERRIITEGEEGPVAISSTTSSTTTTTAWRREVVYGILSLHRLFLHIAEQQQQQHDHDDYDDDHSSSDNNNDYCNDDDGTSYNDIKKKKKKNCDNSYGTTIQTRTTPMIGATTIRILLTVIQSITPALLAVAYATVPTTTTRRILLPRSVLSVSTTDTADTGLLLHVQQRQVQRVSRVRLMVEQIKFALRMYLMVQYWRQQQKDDLHHKITSSMGRPMIGILMDGGMYQPGRQSSSSSSQQQQGLGLSWKEAYAQQRRQDYVGKRTGWRIGDGIGDGGGGGGVGVGGHTVGRSNNDRTNHGDCGSTMTTIVAEILHALRPLLWAIFEANYSKRGDGIVGCNPRQPAPSSTSIHPSTSTSPSTTSPSSFYSWLNSNSTGQLFRGWVICLGMDLVSIGLLLKQQQQQQQQQQNDRRGRSYNRTSNPFTVEELQRRKVRLLLYALRSPFWSKVTEPVLDYSTTNILRRVPLVGSIVETALWDWILYYQHPFIAEED